MSTRSTRRAKRAAQNPQPNSEQKTSAAPPKAALPKSVAPKSVAPKSVAPKAASRAATVAAREKATALSHSASHVSSHDLSPKTWRALAWTILLVAAVLRLWHLDLVPFHHDEGVNGDFLKTLFKSGDYKYNPENFHGPTIYYFALVTSYLNTFFLGKPGFNEIALRLIPAGFGIATIALVFALRRHLGTLATLCAAALLALSPGMVYISRYFIHEMQFVFFTLLAVVAILRFRPRGAWWWPTLLFLVIAGLFTSHRLGDWLRTKSIESLSVVELQFLLLTFGFCVALMRARPLGKRSWLFVASLACALLFGSKETAPISVVVLLFSGALTWLVFPKEKRQNATTSTRNGDMEEETAPRDWRLIGAVLGATYLFWVVTMFFFSSFRRDYLSDGMTNFFKAYDVWRKTGESEFQAKPLLQYVVWMLTIEPTVFVLGFVGGAIALWQRTNKLAVFTAFWALGILVAYSLIPYKTPWLMINFVLPFALLSGFALQTLGAFITRISSTRSANSSRKLATTAAVLAPFLLLSVVQMSYLNFIEYDNDEALRSNDKTKDPKGEIIKLPAWNVTRDGKEVNLMPGDIKKYPYIYVHTQRGYLDLMRKIDAYARLSGLGNKMKIAVTSDEYWPMPWSLRDYPVGYYGKVVNPTDEVLVIGRVNDDPKYGQDEQLRQILSGRYERVGEYPLRPSVLFSLWVRRDLAPN